MKKPVDTVLRLVYIVHEIEKRIQERKIKQGIIIKDKNKNRMKTTLRQNNIGVLQTAGFKIVEQDGGSTTLSRQNKETGNIDSIIVFATGELADDEGNNYVLAAEFLVYLGD